MDCAEVVVLLWEYLDEELAAEEAAAVGAHLAWCGRCHPRFCCDRAFLRLLARQQSRCSAPPGLRFFVFTKHRPA